MDAQSASPTHPGQCLADLNCSPNYCIVAELNIRSKYLNCLDFMTFTWLKQMLKTNFVHPPPHPFCPHGVPWRGINKVFLILSNILFLQEQNSILTSYNPSLVSNVLIIWLKQLIPFLLSHKTLKRVHLNSLNVFGCIFSNLESIWIWLKEDDTSNLGRFCHRTLI